MDGYTTFKASYYSCFTYNQVGEYNPPPGGSSLYVQRPRWLSSHEFLFSRTTRCSPSNLTWWYLMPVAGGSAGLFLQSVLVWSGLTERSSVKRTTWRSEHPLLSEPSSYGWLNCLEIDVLMMVTRWTWTKSPHVAVSRGAADRPGRLLSLG